MISNNLSYLFLPPESTVLPPVNTAMHELPFEQLEWQDFERLCLTVVEIKFNLNDCHIYGIPGQKQHGIDIYARKASGKFSAYQCKRYQEFHITDLDNAVKIFCKGKWASESDEFYICTSCDLNHTQLQERFEELKKELNQKGIEFYKWDADYLNRLLKKYPVIVYRYFGAHWVELFNGKAALELVQKNIRLDAAQIQDYRKKLNSLYSTVFNTYDPGLFSQEIDTKSFLLLDRFIIPDVISSIPIDIAISSKDKAEKTDHQSRKWQLMQRFPEDRDNLPAPHHDSGNHLQTTSGTIQTFETFNSIDQVLTQHSRTVILGEPGSGKSTLLRCLILDLLSLEPKIWNVVKSWGSCLPVWVPFAFITKNLVVNSNASIQELLRLWFRSIEMEQLYDLVEQALHDKRLIIFVDGLDEWSNLSAAQQALTKIEILSDLNETKIVYSCRPQGFKYLQDSIRKVEVLSLAPLTNKKRYEFIYKWLSHWYYLQNEKTNLIVDLNDYIKHQADSFYKEISGSQDLRSLSAYPLLLNILIFQKLKDSALSKNKINAFKEMVFYLIEKHPTKRKLQANIVEDAWFELSDSLKDIFSELALDVLINNSDGIIFKTEVQKRFENYLKTTYGFDKSKAISLSKKLLEIGANSIGIIIEKSPEEISFVHRQFMEFLAAECLINSDKEQTEKILRENCANPLWHQTILAFFSLIPQGRRQEFLYYFSVIESIAPDVLIDHYKKNLQYEIAITLSNAPIELSKSKYTELVHLFSFETNAIHKGKYLNILMDGISNPKLSQTVINFTKGYLPNVVPYVSYIIPALKSIPSETLSKDIINYVLLCFVNGSFDLKLETSEIIRQHIQNEELNQFIDNLLTHETDLVLRAFAINSLISENTPRVKLQEVIHQNSFISDTLTQLFCIRAKIFLKIHSEEDLKILSQQDRNWRFRLEEIVLEMLINGWGDSEKLKSICLNVIEKERREWWGIGRDMAWKILFHSYKTDDKVIDRIIEEINNETYPFKAIQDFHGWVYIAYHFKGTQRLIPAIESFLESEGAFSEPEIAYACLTIHTEKSKQKLLQMLDSSAFPHWIVMALLDGWSQDADVMNALKRYFRSENDRIAYASQFISKIFKDETEERRQIMEGILFSNAYFRERVLTSFFESDKDYFKENILERFLTQEIKRFPEKDDFSRRQSAIHIIAQQFYNDTLVQQTIFNNSNQTYYYFDLIVQNEFPGSPKVYKLLQSSLPLSVELKSKMVQTLDSKLTSNPEILKLYLQFPQETNNELRMSIALRLFKHLKFTDPQQLLSLCSQYVFYRGFDYEIQRQIAFSGYILLKKLPEYYQLKETEFNSAANPGVSFHDAYNKPALEFIQLLIDEFEYIYQQIDGDFNKLTSGSGERHELAWSFFARYSDASSACFSYINNYISDNIENINSIDILKFLYRTSPGSSLLKKLCLGLIEKQNSETEIAAGEILGSNFNNDDSVKMALLGDGLNIFSTPGKIAALCIGWPNEPQLKALFEECRDKAFPISNRAGYYLKFLFRDANHVFDLIIEAILDKESRATHAYFLVPLLRKISMDQDLMNLIIERLLFTDNVNEIISLYSIIKQLGRINEKLAQWRNEALLLAKPLDYGYNLITNSTVHIKDVLLVE